MDSTVEDRQPTDAFGFLLIETGRLFRQATERFLQENGLGLTPSEVRTLAHVIRYGGVRQRILAERMNIEPMTLSTCLDTLERRAMIRRRGDAADRRAKIVEPTDEGFAAMRALEPTLADLYAFVTRGLDPAALMKLVTGLQDVRANLTSDASLTNPLPPALEPSRDEAI